MPLYAILFLALGTFGFRIAGPTLRSHWQIPARLEEFLGDAALVLLVALATSGALTEGRGFAGWARPAGVGLGVCLAVLKAPFPMVVVVAAGATAGLRWLGVP